MTAHIRTAALLLALVFASAARATPPIIQPLLAEGWIVLSEDLTSRAYYRIEPNRTPEGYRRAWLVVDMDARSVRTQREFDCGRHRLRALGATFFLQSGLQGPGQELRGWPTWMGFLDTPRAGDDYNGRLADIVCAAPVLSAPPPPATPAASR